MRIIHPVISIVILLLVVYHLLAAYKAYHDAPKHHIPVNTTQSITGTIVSLPQVSASRTTFRFKSTDACFLVSIYGRLAASYTFRPGDVWQLLLKIKPIRGLTNPGGTNYAQSMRAKGIQAKAYLVHSPKNRLVGHDWYNDPFNLLRYTLKQKIVSLAPQRFLGIFLALSIGDRSLLTPDTWTVFQHTGTSHLVAISGLHIGLVFGLVFGMMRFFLALMPVMSRRYIAQPYALIVALLAAFIYSALAGFAISTIRALLMLTLLCLFKLKQHAFPLWKIFLLTFVLTIILDPLCYISASFWLSFGAVGALIYGLSGKKPVRSTHEKWAAFLLPQWVIFWLLMPATIFYFQQISIVSLLANTIAIPLMSLVIIPLVLVATLMAFIHQAMAALFFWLATVSLSWLWYGLHFLAYLPFWGIHVPRPTLFSLLIAVAGALLWFAPKAMPARYLSLVYLLPLFFCHPPPPPFGTIRFTMLDVGQGLATVIQTQHHVLIYDTGPSYPGGFNAGKSVIVPYLYAQNIFHIDKLVVSHADNDHAGGATYILQNMKVFALETSALKKFKAFAPSFCQGNTGWQWDGIRFMYLPHPTYTKDRNNNSCVLKITRGDHAILLPGDIEKPAETDLVLHNKARLPATILIAPHHGSKTSSSPRFLTAVHPHVVLISAGFGNRFGFPHPSVMSRYQAMGAKVYNTAINGAITLDVSRTHLRITPCVGKETTHILV